MGYYRPMTLGWLLAGNCEQAVHTIYQVCSTPSGSYPSPPLEWLKAILDKAWSELENHTSYHEVCTLHEQLFKLVSQTEMKLMEKLRYIQETYEGGPPPL